MKANIYACYDIDMQVFDQPFFSPIPKTDIKEGYRRQFFHDPEKAYDSHLDCKELYFLGTYDEESGEIATAKERLFQIRDVLPPFVPSEEGIIKTLSVEVAKILRGKN